MPELDPRLRTAEGENRPRPQPVTAAAPKRTSTAPAGEPVPGRTRPKGLSAALWPALTSFALVFAAGVYAFWLLHPGQRPSVSVPPRGVALPSFALVAGWVAGLALLPRLLPRPLAWLLLAAGTAFVAITLSREVTAWLQAVLGQIPL